MSFFSNKKNEHVEKLVEDTLVELKEEKQQYRKEMQNLLMKNDKLEKDNTMLREKYETLKEKYNELVNKYNKLKKNSIEITPRNRGSVVTIEHSMVNKSRSQSSTKGGKTKRNKLRRGKYSITKRKY